MQCDSRRVLLASDTVLFVTHKEKTHGNYRNRKDLTDLEWVRLAASSDAAPEFMTEVMS